MSLERILNLFAVRILDPLPWAIPVGRRSVVVTFHGDGRPMLLRHMNVPAGRRRYILVGMKMAERQRIALGERLPRMPLDRLEHRLRRLGLTRTT